MTFLQSARFAVLLMTGLGLLGQANAQTPQPAEPPPAASEPAQPAPPPPAEPPQTQPAPLQPAQAQPAPAQPAPAQPAPAQPAPAQPAPAQAAPAQAAPAQPADKGPPDLGLRVGLEPQAIDLLKAMSSRLASAKTLSFTAITTYESPARTGLPLAYSTISEVTLKRPNKLRVITPADGPPSEFYYDGKVMMAYSPDVHLVAVAEAPPTIDAMLQAAYDKAAIYFPFTDIIVADPYKDIADKLKVAFVVGQSHVVGGTTTDIVVVASDAVQAQIWIGAKDRLPRMIRATFFNEPGTFRHLVEFTNWRLNGDVPAASFASPAAAKAQHMQFARPDAASPQHP